MGTENQKEVDIKAGQEMAISWNDLTMLLSLLKEVKTLIEKGDVKRAKDLFNKKVNLKKTKFIFEKEEIQVILNKNLPVLLRVYNSYKDVCHKGTLEFDKDLGPDTVELFSRLGR